VNENMTHYDTIIIGAGVVGSSIAYHLSEKTSNILVIDRHFPGAGTSGATQAWVWVHTKQPNWYAEFSMYSAEMYPILKKKLVDIEYVRTGGIAPIFDEDKLAKARELVKGQQEKGIEIHLLSKEEALAKEPYLSDQIIAATYSPLDGNVNPMRLNQAYIQAARRRKVTFSFYNPVTQIQRRGRQFVIQTEKETYTAGQLVLAAGTWTPLLAQHLGVQVPVRPVRGQILITEPAPRFLKHTVSGVRQTVNGEVLIGYSKEEAGFAKDTTWDIIGETARFGIKIIPALRRLRLVRAFAGLRAMPRDGLPIIGPVQGVPGLFLAVMHSGVTLSPIAGMLMSEILAGEAPSFPLEPFRLERFHE